MASYCDSACCVVHGCIEQGHPFAAVKAAYVLYLFCTIISTLVVRCEAYLTICFVVKVCTFPVFLTFCQPCLPVVLVFRHRHIPVTFAGLLYGC